MSILDSAGDLINRGVANAGRGTKSVTLKAQIKDLGKRRESAMADLGASLYEETRNDPDFRASRESLFSAIENLDAQIESLQNELDAANLVVPQPAGEVGIVCPACGTNIPAGDAFCMGCGAKVEPVVQASSLACSNCGRQVEEDDLFCMGCGTPVTKVNSTQMVEEDTPQVESVVREAAESAVGVQPIVPETVEAAPVVAPIAQAVVEAVPAAVPVAAPVAQEVAVAAPIAPQPLSQEVAVSTPAAQEVAVAAPAAVPVAEPVAQEPVVAVPVIAEDSVGVPQNTIGNFCPSCGYDKNKPDHKFCRKCGYKLS